MRATRRSSRVAFLFAALIGAGMLPPPRAICSLGLVCPLLSTGSAEAEQPIAWDDFSEYSANLVNLDGCDVTTGWTAYGDTSSVDQNTTSFKEGTASLQLTYSDSSHRSTAYKTIVAADLSSMSKIGFWAYVGDNTYSRRFEIRVGQAGNYREYRYTGEIYRGWTYSEFDLDSPYTTVGSPDMTSVNYLWVGYYYNSGAAPAHWLVDGISAYSTPNFTAGNFYYINSSNLYGIANYQVSADGTNEMLVNGISRYNSGNHGRVLYLTSTPGNFHASFDFRFNCDEHGVGWMRFLWNFVDGHNYNGVYVTRGYNKAGVEQLTVDDQGNRHRDNQEVGFTASVGTKYHVDVHVRGDCVELYIDGTRITSWNLPQSSLSGPYSFESYSGNIDLYQGYTTSIAVSNVAIFGDE